MKKNIDSHFRPLQLPKDVPGAVFLHSMPGRYESLEDCWRELRAKDIDLVVCLTPLEEIDRKSPKYAAAIRDKTIPCEHWKFAGFPDRGTPANFETFAGWVARAARALRAERRLLIHCAGGVGRTGTFAACLLVHFGADPESALRLVHRSGSGPDTEEQRAMVYCYAGLGAMNTVPKSGCRNQ